MHGLAGIVCEFVDSPDPHLALGIKGLGEPPIIPTAAAIGNAFAHATGVRLREAPFTSQRVLEGLLVVGAIAVYFVPRRKSPLQLAALTAALLIGFEVVLTHWFYLYLPWFFPFAAFALLAGPSPRPVA